MNLDNMGDFRQNTIITSIGYFMLCLSTCWSFYWTFMGVDFIDTFYYCSNFLYSNSISTFIPLTQAAFVFTEKVFGNYLIAYRVVNWVVYFFAYLMFGVLVLPKSRVRLYLIAFAIFFIPVVDTHVFNGNSFTVLFLLLTFVSVKMIVENNNLGYLLLSVLISLSLLTRFPNLVVLPFILIAGLFLNVKYLKLLLSLFISVVLFLVVMGFAYGGLKQYIDAIESLLAFSSQATGNANHSMPVLMAGYLHTLKDMISYMKYLSLINVLLIIAFLYRDTKIIKSTFVILFVFAQIFFIKFRVFGGSASFDYSISVYLFSLISVCMYMSFILLLSKHNLSNAVMAVMPLFFSLVSAAGSDSGLLLIGGQLYAFMPFVFIGFSSNIKDSSRDDLCNLILSLLSLSVFSALYVRDSTVIASIVFFIGYIICFGFYSDKISFVLSKYIYRYRCMNFIPRNLLSYKVDIVDSIVISFVLISFMFLACYQRFNYSFHEKPYKELTTTFKHKELMWIYTNQPSAHYVNDVMDDYDNLKLKYRHVWFYGAQAEIFCYLSKTGMIPGCDFAMNDSERNVSAVQTILSDSSVIYLCPQNPSYDVQYYTLDEYPNLHKMLLSNKYVCERKGLYAVYTRE